MAVSTQNLEAARDDQINIAVYANWIAENAAEVSRFLSSGQVQKFISATEIGSSARLELVQKINDCLDFCQECKVLSENLEQYIDTQIRLNNQKIGYNQKIG